MKENSSIKKVTLSKVPGGENFERVPFNIAFEDDDDIEISSETIKSIERDYSEATEELYDLNESFVEYCQQNGITKFDFSGGVENGQGYYNNEDDYFAFLTVLFKEDIEKALTGTEDKRVKDLAAKYIYTVGVGVIEEKLSEMFAEDDLTTYKWFEKIIFRTSKDKTAYVAFINDCIQEAIEIAYDNEDEEVYSLLANAVVPADPFWKEL